MTYIKREDAIEAIRKGIKRAKSEWKDGMEMAMELIEDCVLVPSADAVSLTETMKYLTKPHNYSEVVRCKDCKSLEVINTENTYAICHEHDIIFEPFEDSTTTNYCSWGERREE